ncbi:MAG TPA: hypothetical protein VGB17_11735 [Pyrinomonadaceae bacterium]
MPLAFFPYPLIALHPLDEKLESLRRDLPDTEGARLFCERVKAESPRMAKALVHDDGLFSDALALAAWSPLLSTTLAQNPDYLGWLARERAHTRVKTREEFGEALSRFSLTHSQLETQVLLARFRRRELLRIYLHDIRRTATLVEVTEELSNLADAVLEYALGISRQDLDNRYGPPQRRDEKGRHAASTFCIVALGKLGSLELNYASDIDLLFLYSDDGKTAATGTRGEITNREYFIKLAETIARIVGQPAGEGAAYRVDLRLRPHGRDGALASSLAEAVRYYREKAHAWELQALIRSRAAAGDLSLYARFAERVRQRVYAPEETIRRALSNVRLAKQKIDRHQAHDTRGFNVKLGRGGIREIEFITQALQLAFGGRDEWLRAAHTLISLGRLADRHLINESERTRLSDAYTFLRTLEHRLQMEHGLQTHSVPEEPQHRALVARRMNFTGETALEDFNRALEWHTGNVRAAYERVFTEAEESLDQSVAEDEAEEKRTIEAGRTARVAVGESHEPTADAETIALNSAARIFAARLTDSMHEGAAITPMQVASFVRGIAAESLNAHRAVMLAARVASSLDKAEADLKLSRSCLEALVRLCGASEFFGELLAANPALLKGLPLQASAQDVPDYRSLLSRAVEGEKGFRAELSALRRGWSRLLVETGALDASGAISMHESNRRQTLLAAASLDAAYLVARRELARREGELTTEPVLAVLGLGRLGGGGMDYGSDLDVVLVYDDAAPSPLKHLTHGEAYARLSELIVATLSSVTRDGYLYRVDLRLRPDGRHGPACSGANSFLTYLRERALPWEWLAYVKLRAAAGDAEFGTRLEKEARREIHQAAQGTGAEALRAETRRVRERLEAEKSGRHRRAGLEIKYGPGGMLDVYFATRYLQLRDNVQDEGLDRSTRATLERLHAAGSLNAEDYASFKEGYARLRGLDHSLRLIVGRSTRLPVAGHPALQDIAQQRGYGSATQMIEDISAHMRSIRAAYDRVTMETME